MDLSSFILVCIMNCIFMRCPLVNDVTIKIYA